MQVRNRVMDALLGQVIGEAMGLPVTNQSRKVRRVYPITEMIGNGTFHQPAGTWGDNTSLAMCLVETLVKRYDLNLLGEKFIKWYFEKDWASHGDILDIDKSTAEAIMNLWNGSPTILAGVCKENSSGCLGRLFPLLIHLKSLKGFFLRYSVIRNITQITHSDIISILCSFYLMEFSLYLHNGKHHFLAYRRANISLKQLITKLKISEAELSKFSRLLSGKIFTLENDQINSSNNVIDILEASIWSLLRSYSYKEAILKAVNLGNATNTIGAVTGGLAGLLYGSESIPESWTSMVDRLEDIKSLATKLNRKYTALEIGVESEAHNKFPF